MTEGSKEEDTSEEAPVKKVDEHPEVRERETTPAPIVSLVKVQEVLFAVEPAVVEPDVVPIEETIAVADTAIALGVEQAEIAAAEANESAAKAEEAAIAAVEAADVAAHAPVEFAEEASNAAMEMAEEAQRMSEIANAAASDAAKYAAAVKIQVTARGKMGRDRAKKLRMQKYVTAGDEVVEGESAIWATLASGLSVDEAVMAAEKCAGAAEKSAEMAVQAAVVAREVAATKIQSIHRRNQSHSRVAEIQEANATEVKNAVAQAQAATEEREMEAAAELIQRHERGRAARKKTREIAIDSNVISAREIEQMESEEAVLQAQHDAIMTKLALSQAQSLTKEQAAVKIQALQRGKLGRERAHYIEMKRRAKKEVLAAAASDRLGPTPRKTAVARPEPIRSEHSSEVSSKEPKSPIANQLQHKLSVVRGEIDHLQNKIVECLGNLDEDSLTMVMQLNARVENLIKIERQVAIAIDHRQRIELPPPSENDKGVKFALPEVSLSPAMSSNRSGRPAGQLPPLHGAVHRNYSEVHHQQSASIQANHKERLAGFYRDNNPAMMDKLDAILAKYRGHEEVLFQKLSRKYGVADQGMKEGTAQQWDGGMNKPRRSASDISGKARAEEQLFKEKQSLRTTEQNYMGRLLRNQIELENRMSRIQGPQTVTQPARGGGNLSMAGSGRPY